MENDTQPKQNSTRVLLWLVVVVVIVALGFAVSGQTPSETIKIGAILPLTGSGQDQGEWMRRGLDMALADTDEGKVSIELIYEDSKGDPKLAVSAYQKLRLERNVLAVITWGSGVGLALAPLVNQDKVIQMGVATAASSYSSPDDFTFRNFPDSTLEADYLVNTVLNRLGAKQIVILKINNDYGVSSVKAFTTKYENAGGRVVLEESFEPNGTDFRTQLSKVKQAKASLVYLTTYPKEGGLVLRQAKELKLESRFIASVAILGGKEFFDIAGTAAEGLYVVTSVPPFGAAPKNETVAAFVGKYEEKYGEHPGPQQMYTARAYDAFKILAQVFDGCGNDTTCVKEALFAVKDYQGASGKFTFDRNGDITTDFNLQTVQNGEFVPIE